MYILLCGYPPFNGNSDLQIFKTILKQDLIFDKEDWEGVSDEAKDLIQKLLVKFPIKRIDMDEAVMHPWLKKNFENDKIEDFQGLKVLERLKNFRIKGKLEMAMRAFLIQNYELNDKQNHLMIFFKKADLNHDGMINR